MTPYVRWGDAVANVLALALFATAILRSRRTGKQAP